MCFYNVGMLILTVKNESLGHISHNARESLSALTYHFGVLEFWDQEHISNNQKKCLEGLDIQMRTLLAILPTCLNPGDVSSTRVRCKDNPCRFQTFLCTGQCFSLCSHLQRVSRNDLMRYGAEARKNYDENLYHSPTVMQDLAMCDPMKWTYEVSTRP